MFPLIHVPFISTQGQIEIMLTVYDIDGTDNRIGSSSDKVTDFRIFPDVAASTDGTFSAESNEESGYSSLQLKFRLTCLPPHFGNNCSQLYSSTSTSECYFPNCLEGILQPLPVTNSIVGFER